MRKLTEITERQQDVYRAIVGLVMDDEEPTLRAIATKIGASSQSGVSRLCEALRVGGWITDTRRPVIGPGKVLKEIDHPEFKERVKELHEWL